MHGEAALLLMALPACMKLAIACISQFLHLPACMELAFPLFLHAWNYLFPPAQV